MKQIIIILQAILQELKEQTKLLIQEEDGTIDIEPLLGKMTDNLIVAATKEYPDLFGGVTIGNGKIKIGIPGIDKDIVLEAADIDHFKSCLK